MHMYRRSFGLVTLLKSYISSSASLNPASGSITSVGEERANLSAVVYL